MVWQGKIEFQKPITINGKPHGVEHLTSIGTWSSDDIGRLVHDETTDKLWFGTATGWEELTPDGVGSHTHDDLYYTEVEVDGMFEGTNGGKQIVDWTNVNNKPTVFTPETHTHADYSLTTHNHDGVYSLTAHTHDTVYSDISHNHDTDYSSTTHNHDTDYSAIDHVHASSSVTYNNGVSSLDATSVQDAIDEVVSDSKVMELTTGAPVDTPTVGTYRFDSSSNTLYIYNGTAWITFLSN